MVIYFIFFHFILVLIYDAGIPLETSFDVCYFISCPLLLIYFGVKSLIITLNNQIKHLLQLNRNKISLTYKTANTKR